LNKIDKYLNKAIAIGAIALLLLILVGSIKAFAIDPFVNIRTDHVLHAEFSYFLTDYMQDGIKLSPLQSFAALGVISCAKEQVDVNYGGKWDNTDIIANYFGWVVRQLLYFKVIL
jgi:hypothetical protein